MATIKAAGFAVTADDGNVYGIGATREAAFADAKEWAQDGDTSGLETVPATQALLDDVREHGSRARDYTTQGGVACLKSESES
jgi:hypothetical protein